MPASPATRRSTTSAAATPAPNPLASPSNLPELISTTPSPEEDSVAAEFHSALDRALDELGEPYRSIVVLREMEGLAYQEIADTLDLPLNTMKVYLHRAKRRLREALALSVPELIPTS